MQVEAEPQINPNLARLSILDPSMLNMETRARRYGDLGHLLPISGNSRNVQVSHHATPCLTPAQHAMSDCDCL